MGVMKHYQLSALAQNLAFAVCTVLKRDKGLRSLRFRGPNGVANADRARERENQKLDFSYPQILWISLLIKNLHRQFL
jgi:hypothetical protein